MNQKRVTETRKGNPAPKVIRRALPKSTRSTAVNGHARRTSLGDITDATTEIGIQEHTVQESVAAAQAAKINAIVDIMHAIPPHDADTLAKVLTAIIGGTSPDEVELLRTVLLKNATLDDATSGTESDSLLSDDWKNGGYPYKFLMSRKSYEKQKYRLQVELLKLQAWVKRTGQRIVILFEGRDAAGKQEQRGHSGRNTCSRKIDGRKMNRRETLSRSLYFPADHFSAGPDFRKSLRENKKLTFSNTDKPSAGFAQNQL